MPSLRDPALHTLSHPLAFQTLWVAETLTPSPKSTQPPVRRAAGLSPRLSFTKSFLLDLHRTSARVISSVKIKGTLRIKLLFLIEMDFLMPFP